MINCDDIEAGDKCFTRDGGCLVAYREIDECGDRLFIGGLCIDRWYKDGLHLQDSPHPLDIIRIEKAPKPVVEEVLLVRDSDSTSWLAYPQSSIDSWEYAIKLTIINGKMDKWEQVK